MKLWSWLKNNKLAAGLALLSLILVVILLNQSSDSFISAPQYDSGLATESVSLGTKALISEDIVSVSDTSEDRRVATTQSLSLVVNQVEDTANQIKLKAEELAGFVVSYSLTSPEESPYAYLSLRVPYNKVEAINDYAKDLAVKVVSEETYGRDITDQYEDIEEKLAILTSNKTRLETIMAQATTTSDILAVQRELIDLQEQIDSLRGRQEYLDQISQLSLVNIYLSTDELALPYQPTDSFRPAVIFKQAVRSLVSSLRSLVGGLIWLVVYGLALLPIVAVIILVRKKLRNRK